MSSVTPSESSRIQESDFNPFHYKPFSSHEHYQQVMSAFSKLEECGYYFGAIGGHEAKSLLRNKPPGTFLIRDSSDHHYFFTLSVQTLCGTKNLRIHSEEGNFFLEPDPISKDHLPQFDCVLKLINFYMSRTLDHGLNVDGENGRTASRTGRSYLIHCGKTKIPLELRKPLQKSLSSLQHMCRRRLNETGLGEVEHLPQTIKNFMKSYDAPI